MAPNAWLTANRRAVLAVLLLIAAITRLVTFVQLSDGPCLEQHRWEASDMAVFDEWGREIAGGNLLSKDLPYPLEVVQRALAREHYANHPNELAALGEDPAGPPSDAAAKAVLDRWIYGDHFYQDPLYPYAIGATYATIGEGPRRVFVLQMLLGILSVPLVVSLGRRLAGEAAGVAAGLLFVFYGPIVHYEATLLRATALSFLGLLIAWLVLRADEGDGKRPWLVVGATIGIGLMLKMSFAVTLLGVIAWMLFRKRTTELAPLLLGVAIGFLPIPVRNLMVGTPVFETASGGAMTFAISNLPGAAAENGFLSVPGTAALLDEHDNSLPGVALATISKHEGFLGIPGWLGVVGGKLAAVVRSREMPNNSNVYFYRRYASMLSAMPLTVGVLLPLAILGVVATCRRWAQALPILAVAASHLAVLLLFFVFSRYRLPLITALIPFAGAGIVLAVEAVRAKRWPLVAGGASLVAAIAIASHQPTPGDLGRIRYADYSAPYAFHWDRLARSAEAEGDWNSVAEIYSDSLAVQPALLGRVSSMRKAATAEERNIVALYRSVYGRYADALAKAGRQEEALDARTRAYALEAAL